MTSSYYVRSTCRCCASSNLVEVLDLGRTPPANSYLQASELDGREEKFPLTLAFCSDCTLLQMPTVVDPSVLFSKYSYVTGASEPMIRHFKSYAETAIKEFIASPSDLAIDIGGNDGVLLDFVKQFCRVLNVDPAANLQVISDEKGIEFYNAFFSSATASDIIDKYGHASIVTANNVFAHVDNLTDVFAGASKLIGDNGVFIAEFHWVKNLIGIGCFDQVYHEHLCFYSLHVLRQLVEHSGLNLFRVEIVPTQGESLRIFAGRARPVESSVGRILEEERISGLLDIETYKSFAERVYSHKEEVLHLFNELKSKGKKVAGYGASAKGNTLLNFYGLDSGYLAYLVDSTPFKQGLFSPGMHLKVFPPEHLREDVPDYLLLLAWNYKDAILEKETDLRERGVKFILTFPELAVI
jgi:hypothetical protein